MGIFDPLISAAQQAGIFAFYLPFLITFALLYGLLSRARIFGEPGRMPNALNAIIAFSVALFVIGFTPAGVSVSKFFGTFFTQTTIVLVTFVVGIIVLILLGETIGPVLYAIDKQGNKVPTERRGFEIGKYGAIILGLVVLGVFINSGGLQALGLGGSAAVIPGVSMQDIVILAFIILTVLLISWVSK